jgi:hypothetical protein
MRSASLTSGSTPDRLTAAVIPVKALRDAADAANHSRGWNWPSTSAQTPGNSRSWSRRWIT